GRRRGRGRAGEGGGRSREAANVGRDGKRAPGVGAPRVVGAVAVQQPAVEGRDTRLPGRYEATVQPDEHSSRPRRGSSPSARRSAAVLSQASASSRSGSESATIPPPAW